MARSAEELGFASVWVTDHLFVPRTMEIIYRDNMLEPLALLSHLAAVVSRVRLGTSVIILPYRNPIIVAKMLATIDQLSHGRLIFGAAVGWMEEEFRALKVPFAERGALSDESHGSSVISGATRWCTTRARFTSTPICRLRHARCSSQDRRSGSAAIVPARGGASLHSATAGTPAA